MLLATIVIAPVVVSSLIQLSWWATLPPLLGGWGLGGGGVVDHYRFTMGERVGAFPEPHRLDVCRTVSHYCRLLFGLLIALMQWIWWQSFRTPLTCSPIESQWSDVRNRPGLGVGCRRATNGSPRSCSVWFKPYQQRPSWVCWGLTIVETGNGITGYITDMRTRIELRHETGEGKEYCSVKYIFEAKCTCTPPVHQDSMPNKHIKSHEHCHQD